MNKILIGFGVLWICIWSIFGLFLNTQWNRLLEKITIAAQERNLEKYHDMYYLLKTNEEACMFALYLAILVILIGLVIPQTKLSNTSHKILGGLLITGTVLCSLFRLMWFLPLVIAGTVLILAALFMVFVGVVLKYT